MSNGTTPEQIGHRSWPIDAALIDCITLQGANATKKSN